MLSESSFSDRALAEDFYTTLFDRFCESCEPTVRETLHECTFGLMPDRVGVKTLFIVAPNQFLTQQLKNHTDSIANRVADLMPGIGRVALCFLPPSRDANVDPCNPKLSQFIMGHIFPIPTASELF